MNSHPLKYRLLTLAGFFLAVLLAFFYVLYETQIVHGSEYLAQSISSNAKRETVDASRGIITDRNGKVLVSNRLSYTLSFSSADFSDDESLNDAILRLVTLFRSNNTVWVDTLPLTRTAPYIFRVTVEDDNLQTFLNKTKIPSTESPAAFFRDLRAYFHIADTYTDAQARDIVGVRYELILHGGAYIFSEDVDVALLSQITDGHYTGTSTGTTSLRIYNTPYAAHILGRISRIYQEDWDQYADLGYSMDALVGESGVERAFESYLHGRSGTRLYTTDESGKVTS